MSVTHILPLAIELPFEDPASVFARFHDEPWAIFLDSAKAESSLGRYSFIGISPFLTISSHGSLIKVNHEIIEGNPFDYLQGKLKHFILHTNPDLPPFQGGAAGYLGYDLCHHLEKLPSAEINDLDFPDMAMAFYDLVIGFDLFEKRAWIFSSGYPKQILSERMEYAHERLKWLQDKIKLPCTYQEAHVHTSVSANFTPENYEKAVQKAIHYIEEGDIFEVNIAQRFQAALPEGTNPFSFYTKLREKNPAPFSAYFNTPEVILASASPERFLKLQSHHVETRPIKGTCPRGKTAEEDLALAQELMSSEKDRAENIMIVDLMRNDLSRVCLDHTVKVHKLCGLETFATVHHLVSVITAQLKSEFMAVDLLKATFPGGSITGAPKIRAMEIIAEIEPHRRGPYCGSMGYLGFNGDMDTSIIIRTFAIRNNVITFHAGGAIVADSDPRAEYQETLDKASALKKVLES
jgi:para-aminobenzoate synthetase component 1